MKLELTPKQGLSLSMQTSMHLLQLNNLQLRNYIGELMTSNAVVELEFPDIEYRPSLFDRLRAPQHVAKQTDNPSKTSKEQLMADKAAEFTPLTDLFLQSAAMKLAGNAPQIMEHLIHSLDENGYLTEDADAIAQCLNMPLEEVEECMDLLQSMEPAGIGAASLKDCLRLQLVRSVPQDETALRIVETHLEAVAKQQYSVIARELQIPKQEVVRACKHIRSLNPKPLNGLSGEVMTQFIIPDFYVVEDNGQLRCIINDYFLPKIKIDLSYQRLINGKTLSQKDSDYLQRDYKQATEVLNHLTYRKETLLRVIDYILKKQADFFRHGEGHRTAMSNREIAQALSLHESTVSRAVNGKFFECKWGVYPLKSLFIHNARPPVAASDTEKNFDEILCRLRELVESEVPGAAYSDQQLAALLAAEGVQIARRTVAKYRQILDIPTASQRNAQHARDQDESFT